MNTNFLAVDCADADMAKSINAKEIIDFFIFILEDKHFFVNTTLYFHHFSVFLYNSLCHLLLFYYICRKINRYQRNIDRIMKQFFKNVAATIVGIFGFGIIMVILAVITLIGMICNSSKTPSLKDNSVMVMKLQGQISDQANDDWLGQLTGNQYNNLGMNNILSAIKKAKQEDKVKGIYLETGILSTDYATLLEIRSALADFKKANAIKENALVLTWMGFCNNNKAANLQDVNEQKKILTETQGYLEKARDLDPNQQEANWKYLLYNTYYVLYGADDSRTKALDPNK